MIKGAFRTLLIGLLLLAPAATGEALTIGYLELSDDPRYRERSAYARIQLRSQSRPLPGARVAVNEARMIGQAIDVEFTLQHHRGENLDELARTVERWAGEGIRFILLDLPAATTAKLAAESRDSPVLLFNVSAPESRLRRGQCAAHLMHTLPSHAMETDALVQYLASRKWRKLLVLKGPRERDRAKLEALRHSAQRFGADLVAVRDFRFGNDPRQRDQNNVTLLTAGINYDAVVVLDSEGEFGRYVPYQTKAARPVVGTTGLVPEAWTWVWERHGAPQVNQRFQDLAGRRMAGPDWAAWVAVKAIVQSALRNPEGDFQSLAQFLKSEDIRVDGAKGPALSFRNWNNQLRQPILLATHDAVIARAPVDGFLHPRNTLDTLGDDRGDSDCRLAASDQGEHERKRGGASG